MFLHVVDHTDGDWQCDNLVECLSNDLGDHQADQYLERYFGSTFDNSREDIEGQWEEDDGVSTFAYNCRSDGSEGEIIVFMSFVPVC